VDIIIMDTYICIDCKREFKRKCHYKNHINRKIKCTVLLDKYINKINITPEDRANALESFESSICMHCNNQYKNKTTLFKHLKSNCKKIQKYTKISDDNDSCIVMRDIIGDHNEDKNLVLDEIHINNDIQKWKEYVAMIKKLKEENKTLRDKIDNYDNNKNMTINNIINNDKMINNTTNNITQINIINYGKEDMHKLSEKEILEILNYGPSSVLQLTENIHFNPKRPEYHNIYMGDTTSDKCMVYNNEWTHQDKSSVINNLYDNKKKFIETEFDKLGVNLKDITKDQLLEFFDDDTYGRDIIKKGLISLLYNKRNICLKK